MNRNCVLTTLLFALASAALIVDLSAAPAERQPLMTLAMQRDQHFRECDTVTLNGPMYIHESIHRVINFSKADVRMQGDHPLVVWCQSADRMNKGDTLLWSFDLHDAGQCVLTGIDRIGSVTRALQLRDGERRFSLLVRRHDEVENREQPHGETYIAAVGHDLSASVEQVLTSLLASSLAERVMAHSSVGHLGDTIQLSNTQGQRIRIRLWMDILPTGRIGGFVVSDQLHAGAQSQHFDGFVFIVFHAGQIRVLQSDDNGSSEDPSAYQEGAEVARF